MRHGNRVQEEGDGLPGEDSFLDIVANIVGILIILVMVVGVRASQGAFSEAQTEETTPVAATVAAIDEGVEDEAERAEELARLIQQRGRQATELATERQIAEAERARLLAIQSVQEEDIDARRARLDTTKQRQFDVQQQLVEAQLEHESLTRERMTLLSQPADVEEIEALPTPIASAVDGPTIHVRLRHGLISVVPFDALKDEFLNGRLGYLRDGVRTRNEVVDVVGPIEGYRMRLEIQLYREQPVGISPMMAARVVRVEEVQTWTILPVDERLGEPVEQALDPSSRLASELSALRAGNPAVVAWVYPDSYDQLRQLKRMLWERRTPMAVWPLDEDDQIVFSSRGSKAAAQ